MPVALSSATKLPARLRALPMLPARLRALCVLPARLRGPVACSSWGTTPIARPCLTTRSAKLTPTLQPAPITGILVPWDIALYIRLTPWKSTFMIAAGSDCRVLLLLLMRVIANFALASTLRAAFGIVSRASLTKKRYKRQRSYTRPLARAARAHTVLYCASQLVH
jgi:hypothetical protein